jgi:hypothetical protein
VKSGGTGSSARATVRMTPSQPTGNAGDAGEALPRTGTEPARDKKDRGTTAHSTRRNPAELGVDGLFSAFPDTAFTSRELFRLE